MAWKHVVTVWTVREITQNDHQHVPGIPNMTIGINISSNMLKTSLSNAGKEKFKLETLINQYRSWEDEVEQWNNTNVYWKMNCNKTSMNPLDHT